MKFKRKRTITEFIPETGREGREGLVIPQASGEALRVRFVSHDLDHDRPVLCIEIEADTNEPDSWQALKNLAKELDRVRGPWRRWGGYKETVYLDSWKWHEAGYSWGEIARKWNDEIRQHLAQPDPRWPDHAATLAEWAGAPIGADFQPEDVLNTYPVDPDKLGERVRDWHKRYRTGKK